MRKTCNKASLCHSMGSQLVTFLFKDAQQHAPLLFHFGRETVNDTICYKQLCFSLPRCTLTIGLTKGYQQGPFLGQTSPMLDFPTHSASAVSSPGSCSSSSISGASVSLAAWAPVLLGLERLISLESAGKHSSEPMKRV